MAKGQQRDPKREASWRKVLDRHRASGLSVRAFCEREGLAESAWYAWRRTIRQRNAQRPADRPAFVPVVVHAEDRRELGGAIAIELRGGRVIRLPISMPLADIAVLVRAIEDAT